MNELTEAALRRAERDMADLRGSVSDLHSLMEQVTARLAPKPTKPERHLRIVK